MSLALLGCRHLGPTTLIRRNLKPAWMLQVVEPDIGNGLWHCVNVQKWLWAMGKFASGVEFVHLMLAKRWL